MLYHVVPRGAMCAMLCQVAYIAPCCAMLSYILLCWHVLCCAMLLHVVLCSAMLRYVVLCSAMLYYVVLCCACCAMLCYVALCCAMLRYDVLCRAMFCYVSLCCVMLHYIAPVMLFDVSLGLPYVVVCCTLLHYVALCYAIWCYVLPYCAILCFIIWLAPRAGKITQIVRRDWLPPERARWSHLARSGLPTVSRKKHFPESYVMNPLLTKFVRSRWLDISLFYFFCEFIDHDFVSDP